MAKLSPELGFNLKKKTLESTQFKNYYFIINQSFAIDLANWITKKSEKVPVIDNSQLFEPGTLNYQYNGKIESFSHVNETLWAILIKYFGGGPEIKVRYNEGIDVTNSLRYLRVVQYPNIRKFKGIVFNSYTLLHDIKREMCKECRLLEKKVKVMDFHNGFYYQDIDCTKDLKKQALFYQYWMNGNIVLLEVSNYRDQHEHFIIEKNIVHKTRIFEVRDNLLRYVKISIKMEKGQLLQLRKLIVELKTVHLSLLKKQKVKYLFCEKHSLRSFTLGTGTIMNYSRFLISDCTFYLFLKQISKAGILHQRIKISIKATRTHKLSVKEFNIMNSTMSVLERLKSSNNVFNLIGLDDEKRSFYELIMNQNSKLIMEQGTEVFLNLKY